MSSDLIQKLSHEHAIADGSDDDDDDKEDVNGGRGGRPRVVELKEGYGSASGSDTEDDEESADILVAKEVERRGAKEGSVFVSLVRSFEQKTSHWLTLHFCPQ